MDEPRILLAGLSDLGKGRENQEDAFAILEPTTGAERRRSGRLLMVADGIGGSRAGEVASRLAADTLPDAYAKATGSVRQRLRFAIQDANHAVMEHAERTPLCRGMGSTVVVAAIVGDRLTIGWLGDSRAYLIRDGAALQLTTDHRGTAVPGMSSGGLTRFIGMGLMVDPDVRELSLHPGDRILLCTDGLHGLVSPEEMARASSREPAQWNAELVALALRRGAPDNITLVTARVDRLPFAPHRLPQVRPGVEFDGLRLLDEVGQDQFHLWYRAAPRAGGATRLLYLLKPELQDDPELLLEMEEEEESLARCKDPSTARVERQDEEKSLAYVCLDPLFGSRGGLHGGSSEMHSLEHILHALSEFREASEPAHAVAICLQIARSLAGVRSWLLPAGAPHPSDFWGNGEEYVLCRWPSARRQYGIATGKGLQVNPVVARYIPPDYGPSDTPGSASDAYFVGQVLFELLGAPASDAPLPPAVERALQDLLAPRSAARPDAVRVLERVQRELAA